MNNGKRKVARQRLDERLSAFPPKSRFAVPPKGWIRAIRDALGMSAVQFGTRIGMKPQCVSDLETSKVFGELLSKVGDAGFRRRVRLAFLRP